MTNIWQDLDGSVGKGLALHFTARRSSQGTDEIVDAYVMGKNILEDNLQTYFPVYVSLVIS